MQNLPQSFKDKFTYVQSFSLEIFCSRKRFIEKGGYIIEIGVSIVGLRLLCLRLCVSVFLCVYVSVYLYVCVFVCDCLFGPVCRNYWTDYNKTIQK